MALHVWRRGQGDRGTVPADPRSLLRPTRAEAAASGVFGVLALTGLLSIPLLAASDEDAVGPLPAAWSVGWWVVVVVLVAQAVALLWVRRAPRVAATTAAALPWLVAALAPSPLFGLTTGAVLVAVFAVALLPPLRRLVPVLALAAVLVAGAQTVNDVRSGASPLGPALGVALVQALGVVGVPLPVALTVAARREAREARDKEVRALQREHVALVDATVSRERAAMSRELHDIAAHHMSGIALMASAIVHQVDTDPAEAKRSAQQVRAQSTAVLDDLRRLVGLLREGAGAGRAVESLASVRDLVAARRAAGADVRLVVHGAGHAPDRDGAPVGAGPSPSGAGAEADADAGTHEQGAGVGPLAQLVVYRMVQESLANAAVHAPGAPCVVEVDDRDDDRLVVVVRNARGHGVDPGPGGGFGLVGMHERAELVGGRLRYGPTPDGGWEVRLRVPRDGSGPAETSSPAPPEEPG